MRANVGGVQRIWIDGDRVRILLAGESAPRVIDRKTLGRLSGTRATLAAQEKARTFGIVAAMLRHESGQWGLVHPELAEMNDDFVKQGEGWPLSRHEADDGTHFCVLSQIETGSALVCLPEELPLVQRFALYHGCSEERYLEWAGTQEE